MNHYIDIDDQLFAAIQSHEQTEICLGARLFSAPVRTGDELKLYHPGDPHEALRVEVVKVEDEPAPSGTAGSGEPVIRMQIRLTEWLFQIETDIDDQVAEDDLWF